MNGLEQRLHKLLDEALNFTFDDVRVESWWLVDGSLASTMRNNNPAMYRERIIDKLWWLYDCDDGELLDIYNAEYLLLGDWEAHGITSFKKDLEEYGYDLPDELADRYKELLTQSEEEGATNGDKNISS